MLRDCGYLYVVLVYIRCVSLDLGFFFFFQAEDGIRDHCVTGVQTCALPIYLVSSMMVFPRRRPWIKYARMAFV